MMTRADIIKLVKYKMAEATDYDIGEVADESLIDKLLDPGVRGVLMKAPLHLITPELLTLNTSTGDGFISISLPNEYLRLHTLLLSTHEKVFSDFDIIKEGDPKIVYLGFKTMRGSKSKPKIYLLRDGDNNKILKLYNGTISKLLYIKETKAENLQESLIDALTWRVAGDTLLILEESNYKLCYEKEAEFYATNK